MLDGEGEVVYAARFKLDCDCANEACEHFIAELNNSIQEAWQAGRKAGIAAVIEKLRESAQNGLVLRLQDGELVLPESFGEINESVN
jgi:hypothetical protein